MHVSKFCTVDQDWLRIKNARYALPVYSRHRGHLLNQPSMRLSLLIRHTGHDFYSFLVSIDEVGSGVFESLELL
eukprot:12401437-Karenia_brevis.AAC.1